MVPTGRFLQQQNQAGVAPVFLLKIIAHDGMLPVILTTKVDRADFIGKRQVVLLVDFVVPDLLFRLTPQVLPQRAATLGSPVE